MKKEDLIAKCWIITDPAAVLTRALRDSLEIALLFSSFLRKVTEMREPPLILYSQELYGG